MSQKLGTDKEVEKLRRIAEQNGFDVKITNSNHLKWRAPHVVGELPSVLVSPLTFGDPRRIKKIEKFLTSHGVELTKRKGQR